MKNNKLLTELLIESSGIRYSNYTNVSRTIAYKLYKLGLCSEPLLDEQLGYCISVDISAVRKLIGPLTNPGMELVSESHSPVNTLKEFWLHYAASDDY